MEEGAVLEPTSSRVLAIILDKPGYKITIHITIYLSTAGRDSDFCQDLVSLQTTIDNVAEKYPESFIFVRGDANAAAPCRNQNKRDELFKYFLDENKFSPMQLKHHTYHHFTNNGLSDSNIDIIAGCRVSPDGISDLHIETLDSILCSKTNSVINSSHDAILSSWLLSPQPKSGVSSGNIKAPKINHTKHKIYWDDDGVAAYQELLSDVIPSLQASYSVVTEPEVASVLFRVTNHILTEAARQTNKSVELGKEVRPRKPVIPNDIRTAMKVKAEALKNLNLVDTSESSTGDERKSAKAAFIKAKSEHQNLVRKHNVNQEVARDSNLLDLLSKQPRDIFKAFKRNKTDDSSKLKALKVGNRTYTEQNISDGFFDSISQLKTLQAVTASSFDRFSEDHRHITEICKSGRKIPKLSLSKAEELLRKIRPGVSDFFSITAAHYINGGVLTIKHFQFLINTIIDAIELAATDELNKIHAIILHKGHKKDKTLASSYRTISSCPFLAKALDIYLGDLSKDDWSLCQASSQFQGSGMSHELASLLLTISIQDSISCSKPLFILLLDAKSAFDLVIREILVRRLFLDTTPDQRIRYWDLRLANRTTFCQWGNDTMGPIKDQLGVEQGGPNGSEFYKIYNNEQLTVAQESGLGILVSGGASIPSGIPVAAVGQADDTALLSHDLHQLQCLLDLSVQYCEKHQVQLSAGKTKLLVFSNQDSDYIHYWKMISPLRIGDTTIEFTTAAEHVGVIRAVTSNFPHVHQRILCHKRALAKILSMGMSRRHRANPIAALRAESIFASPILFSGMASLLLTQAEITTIAQHVKETTERLLKLHPKTPEPVVFFLAGRLPGEALLHIKQLTLFGMICRLPGNILNNIAHHLLTYSSQGKRHWFAAIRTLCHKYNLPHPMKLLQEPPTKGVFKNIIKNNVTDFWQESLRNHSASLKSLKFFKPNFMSLRKPHPMWQMALTSYQVNKCITVSRMLSGRFKCGSLLRHMYPNISGICELCNKELEDLPHILVPRCPLLSEKALSLVTFARESLFNSETDNSVARAIFENKLSGEDDSFVQFLLDPSVVPEVIAAEQNFPGTLQKLMSITITWCYSLNRTRVKLKGN